MPLLKESALAPGAYKLEWRPWDPGFFARGPNNIWDVWVMEVNGFRVVIVNGYFPETPTDVLAELQEIAESVRFAP